MKRLSVLLLGISMLTLTGCCCGLFGHGWGTGYWNGYRANCPGGVGGVGGVGGTTVPPQGPYYQQGYNSFQSGYAPLASPVAAVPMVQPIGYPRSAAIPLNPLPTY